MKEKNVAMKALRKLPTRSTIRLLINKAIMVITNEMVKPLRTPQIWQRSKHSRGIRAWWSKTTKRTVPYGSEATRLSGCLKRCGRILVQLKPEAMVTNQSGGRRVKWRLTRLTLTSKAIRNRQDKDFYIQKKYKKIRQNLCYEETPFNTLLAPNVKLQKIREYKVCHKLPTN